MDAKTGANVKTAKLTLGDKDWSFPVHDGTIGPEVVDVSKLYSEAGVLSTVTKLEASNEPKKNAFQLVLPACTAAE